MTIEKTPMMLIWQAISAGDLTEVRRLFGIYPEQINDRIPFAGGTFLHLAATEPNVEIIEYLLDIGFDLHAVGTLEGDGALCGACDNGHYAVAEYLLDRGAEMDVSTSVRNPLFAAIVGQSVEIAKLLIERGIDTAVRYSDGTDATAFALERGELAIAHLIAMWNAEGDPGKAQALLNEAKRIVEANMELHARHKLGPEM